MNKKDLINALSAKLQKDKKNLLRTAKRRNLYIKTSYPKHQPLLYLFHEIHKRNTGTSTKSMV